MSERLVVSEDDVYELLAYLVASAELCTFEPYLYGTARLIEAAKRLMECILRQEENGNRAWLEAFKQEIDEKKWWKTWDRAGYLEFLGAVTGKVAVELKQRAAARAG